MTEIKRIFDFPYYMQKTYNLEKAFSTKYNGAWESISTIEYINKANAISRGLLKLGVKPNDKIAVISSTNRTEWNIVDIGVLQTGAQNVPIYPTISANDYQYILNHSESIYCFVSDKSILEKLNQIKAQTPLKAIFTFDDIPNEENWKDVLKLGEDTSYQEELESRMQAVKPNDLATLIYTSGTTGKPKGVMLSHTNLVSNVIDSKKRVPFKQENSKALSFLPVCHVFERMILYLYQYCGTEIYFAESIEKMSDNLKEISPTVMTAVPRLYEKVYDKIVAKGADLKGIKKALFFWALSLGLKYEPYKQNGWWYEWQLKIARKLIFSKWKEGLGGKMRNEGFRIGTVGKVIDHVTVKIATDGEILVKGPNVMLGYFKDSEKTNEAINNGYFHTGDIGEVSKDGFLKITDRKKEMFKTSGGKYVAPALIENQLKQSRFIEQVMVIGEGEKMPAALIQLSPVFIKEWAERHKINYNSFAEVIKNETLVNRIQEEINGCNSNFGKWEQIKKFELTPDIWSIDAGHLTPTMKMKRKVIKEKYAQLIEQIYRG